MNVIEKPLLIKGYHGTIPDKVKLVCTQKENEYYFYGNILQFLEAINDKFIFLPTKDEETKKSISGTVFVTHLHWFTAC